MSWTSMIWSNSPVDTCTSSSDDGARNEPSCTSSSPVADLYATFIFFGRLDSVQKFHVSIFRTSKDYRGDGYKLVVATRRDAPGSSPRPNPNRGPSEYTFPIHVAVGIVACSCASSRCPILFPQTLSLPRIGVRIFTQCA